MILPSDFVVSRHCELSTRGSTLYGKSITLRQFDRVSLLDFINLYEDPSVSFENQILIQRLAVPGVAGLIGCWLLLSTKYAAEGEEHIPLEGIVGRTILGSLVCAFGLIASDFLQRDLLFEPKKWLTWESSYQWKWMAIGFPAVFVFTGLLRCFARTPNKYGALLWPCLVAIAVGALYVCLVEKETWGNVWPAIVQSLAVGVVASTLNIATIDNLASSGASRWASLVLVGQLGAVAAIAFQSYGSLGEWALACIGLALGASLSGLLIESRPSVFASWQLSTVIYPLCIAAVASMCLTGFFRSEPLPFWLNASILFLPTIVWFFDLILTRERNHWLRASVAAILCGVAVATILVMTKAFESSW